MISNLKAAGTRAVLCACFLFFAIGSGAVAAERYLSGGVPVYGENEKDINRQSSPLDDLNWLRNKAATEEIKRRDLETKVKILNGELDLERARAVRLESKVVDLEEQVEELKSRPAVTAVAATSGDVPVGYAIAQGYYEVKEGDSLWKIAANAEVFSDPRKWTEIYFANKDKIENPDIIYPGQVLEIPDYYIVPELSVSEVAAPNSQS